MSRLGVALKIFAIACFVLLLWVGCASASTLVVNQTFPACITGDEYFTSIQAAVDRAQEGDEIVVCPGIYVENINITKSISIESYSGSANTIIEAKNINDDVITITANKVNISGFTIRDSEADGIYQKYVENCNLSGNSIYSTRNGIRLFLSNNNTINYNTVNFNDNSGIWLVSSNDNLISNNTANSNKQFDGFELKWSNNNIIIANNASYNFDSGIALFDSSNNTIRGNTANSNEYHGISLSVSNNNIIMANNASNNFQCGIVLFNSSNNNAIIGNMASSNNKDGIYIKYSHNNSILNNTANSNQQFHGIDLISSNNNNIINNNASYNFASGIALFDSSNNTIRGNTANSNKQIHGIYLSSSNNNDIIENNASYNFDTGIGLFDSSNNTIRGNTANSNKQAHGICLESSSNNTIIDNNASYNFQIGIALIDSNDNTIRGNIANSNKMYSQHSPGGPSHGIGLFSSNNNIIIENNALNNMICGIVLLQSSNNNNIIDNNVSNNMQSGIRLFNSSNNTLKGNKPKSNKYQGIELESSNNNDIIDNNASNNMRDGILLHKSNNNIIKDNTANSNKNWRGIELGSSNNNNIINNNASNNGEDGIVLLSSSSNNTLKGNTLNSNQDNGISLGSSSNNIILDNDISYNFDIGLTLQINSDNNTINANIFYSNLGGGISLVYSQRNNILNNIINFNSGHNGIILGYSKNNNIINNIINSNQVRGLAFTQSSENKIMNNYIDLNGEEGIFLSGNSSSIIISGNTISSNYFEGIDIKNDSYHNKIYHNNIINDEVWDVSLNNWWCDNSLKEGNYWSDYNGVDTDGDGVGDTNIPHPEEGYDFYPFMNRDGWLTISVWPHYLDFGRVYQGTEIKNQTFTITNYGNSVLNVSSIKSDPTISISDIELPAVIQKGHSQSFNITLNTEKLEGFVLKNIEIISNDLENHQKNISIFGFVEAPIHNIEIRGVDYQSRVIKGQINLFNVTINNTGDFREKNVSIEFKEGDRSLGNATIENIESKENKSAIFRWDTADVSPKTYDILIEVKLKLKDQQISLATLQVPVKVDMPSAAQTLIITNKERLNEFWGVKRTEKLENELFKLSYHVSVAGIPVFVEEDEAVAGSYQLWDSSSQDPEKANDVAKEIKRLIDDKLREYTGIRYIIIVGGDRIIPFYRIPDNTDKPFVSGRWWRADDYLKVNKDSTVGSALHDNMFLTDNIYAADRPIEWKTGEVNIPELFIPNILVSRLVESPGNISAVIEAFYREEYVNPDKIFVTGHAFMSDSASDCSSTLENKTKGDTTTVISRNDTEVTDDYFDKVEKGLLNTGNDVILVFQHAEHDLFSIPKYQAENGNITSQDISTSVADLNSSVVCSLGCHSGLNVPPNSSIDDFDLAQAFAQKGVLAYIAPTSYSIGLYRTIGAHELLISYFTKYLCEGMDVGTALTLAKQEYWATNYDFSYIDEQVLETTTLYGLPMVRINIPRLNTSSNESGIEIKSIEQDIPEKPDILVIRPTYTTINISTPLTLPKNIPLTYYMSKSGELLSDPNRPLQPKEIRIFHPTLTRMLHGAVLTSAKYQVRSIIPLIDTYMQSPTWERESESPVIEDWYPAQIFKMKSIRYPRDPTESRQYLVIVTGQYKGPTFPSPYLEGRMERLYDELSFDLYYASPGEETTPPVIKDVSHNRINHEITITVNASDDESGIRRVLVTYTDIDGLWEEWRSEDCKLWEGDLWTCNIHTEEEIEFFVQAVDNAGNVAIKDNEGKYFKK